MSRFKPVGVETLPTKSTLVTGRPPSCYGQLRERSRFEWRIGDTGDPAQLLEDFLESNGLTVRDIGGIGGAHTERCGASVFVSAAAGARMIGAPAGRPSPAPRVPDVVAVAYAHGESAAPPREGHGRWRLGPWRDSWTPADHAAAVERARAAIGRGDVYQVNVVGHASAPYTGDPLPALRTLAEQPGARYAGVLSGRGWAIGCASPETLVEVRGGRIVTRPIKGTRPATVAGRRELLASAKERAEHVMIVDLERNDLARLAETGTVRVDDLYALRRWCDLWQAESVVSAVPAPGIGLADLLRAVCPGGSVTGAPKLSALREIAAMEPVGRGASMGALGWVGPDHLDLGLTIRTAAAADSRVHLWAGGGITWSSDAAAEVAEAAAKAAPLRRALAHPAPS